MSVKSTSIELSAANDKAIFVHESLEPNFFEVGDVLSVSNGVSQDATFHGLIDSNDLFKITDVDSATQFKAQHYDSLLGSPTAISVDMATNLVTTQADITKAEPSEGSSSAIHISFDFAFIDQWEGEEAWLEANGKRVR